RGPDRSPNSPVLIKEPGEENRFRDRRDWRPWMVITHFHDRPVPHTGKNHVTEAEFWIMVRMPAVEDHVTTFRPRQVVWEDQLEPVIRCPVMRVPELDLLARPAERKFRQEISDPGVTSGIAEEDQVRPAHVVFGYVDVLLDGQVAAVMTPPLRGEAVETCVGPGTDGWIPRLSGATDAEKASGEGVVDGALKSWPLAWLVGPIPAALSYPLAIP